jgi:MFS family permease
MSKEFKTSLLPVFSLTLIMIGVSFFETFVSLRLSLQQFHGFIAALIYSSYYAGMLIGGLFFEKVIQKLTHGRTFILCAATISAIISLQSFTSPHLIWIAFRLLSGMMVAGVFISIESWLLLLFPTSRGIALAFYMIGLYIANSLGQFGISAVTLQSHHPFSLILIFTTVSIIPICFIKNASPLLEESRYLSVFKLYTKTPLGFLGNLTSGLILGAFYTIGPLCAKASNFTMIEISSYMAITIFGGMLMQWPMGKLSDTIKRTYVIRLICFMIIAYSLLAIFVLKSSFILQLLVQFLFGGMIFTLYPVCITYCCDFLSERDITSVAAAGIVNYGLGSIFGPAIALLFLKLIGASGFYIYTAILGIALLLFSFFQKKSIDKRSEKV